MNEPPLDGERTLPHSLEAEKAVIGGILIDNSAFERVSGTLQPEYFYRNAHRLIYRAIRELVDVKRVAVDWLTLREELARTGDLEDVGGPAYVSGLMDGVPRSVNLRFYASIVREKYLLRSIILASNKTIAAAYDAEDEATTILAKADLALLELQRTDIDRRINVRHSASQLLAEVERRFAHRGELTGVPTGFTDLNRETLGWQAGDLIVVGARPSMGKTALALNNARAVAEAGKRVAVFSMEMSRQQLEFRLLSSVSKVPLSRILSGACGEKDQQDIGAAWSRYCGLDLEIDDKSDHTAQDIRAACRRIRAEGGLDLVIVDYVQLIPGNLDRRGATRTEELSDISRRLKRLAVEMGMPVMVLSQLKRTGGTRPTLEDLRECGSLEQDADVALLLHRKNHREGGTTEAILAKQRNGPTGTVLLSFDRDTVTFSDAPEDAAAPAEEPARPSTRRKYAIAANRRRKQEENPELPA